jgi:aldehyde:ferredoxin oxidoreductase
MVGGPATGHVVELDPMLDEYYRIMGWDENGIPTRERLEDLGLII